MKLYYTPGLCSLSPHIVLREAGVPVELKKVNLKAKEIEGGGDYWKVNPKGYIPALGLDDGQVLTEGAAIVQYLADKYPEYKLAPANGTMERYRLQEMLTFLGTEIHKFFTPFRNPAGGDAWKAFAETKLTQRYSYLNGLLDDRDYLFGNQFSVADAYLFATLTWLSVTPLDRKQWPALDRFYDRVAARPAVQEAMRAEGLIE